MDTQEIINLLKESNNEKKLKIYLSKINNIFGEDYAVSILTSDVDIIKSIAMYSSKFNYMTEKEIIVIFLKSIVLSNNDCDEKNFIIDRLCNKDFIQMEYLIKRNLYFRKVFARDLIKNSNMNNVQLFKNKKNKKEAVKELLYIDYYKKDNSTIQTYNIQRLKKRF